MARSSYKLPFVHRSLWERSINNRKYIRYSLPLLESVFPETAIIKPGLHFWKRSSLFSKRFGSSNRGIGIYNGKGFHFIYIKKSYSGYKLGQFNITRRTAVHSGKQRQKKKRENKKVKVKKK